MALTTSHKILAFLDGAETEQPTLSDVQALIGGGGGASTTTTTAINATGVNSTHELDFDANTFYTIDAAGNTTLTFTNKPAAGEFKQFKLYMYYTGGSLNGVTWIGSAPSVSTTNLITITCWDDGVVYAENSQIAVIAQN